MGSRGLFVRSVVRDVVVVVVDDDDGAGLREVVVVVASDDVEVDESKPPAAEASLEDVDRLKEDSEFEFGRPSLPKVCRRRREVGPRESREAWADVRLLDAELDIGLAVNWLGCRVLGLWEVLILFRCVYSW